MIADSGGFTDHEKGDIAAEKGKLSQAKAAATTQQSPQPTKSTAPASTPAPPGEKYPLAPDKSLETQLTQLVGTIAVGAALGEVQTIRGSFTSSAQKYMGFQPPSTRDPDPITEDDILKNLARLTDVFHDVLFVSKKFSWNPDEVLALWTSEGLPKWIRNTRGVELVPGDQSWTWLKLPAAFDGLRLTDKEARAIARSFILHEYWGLDFLVPAAYNAAGGDTKLTVVDTKKHDAAFDTGFNQIGSFLSGVTAVPLREALTKDGLEFYEESLRFRLRPEFQATLLALQHARFKSEEAEVIKANPLKLQSGGTATLTPTFPALIYMRFNTGNLRNVELVTAGVKKKQASYAPKELCEALLGSELPSKVVESLEACRKNFQRVNCHGYMNAIRFEFLRRVYEKVFQPTGVGSPRGCPG